MTRTGETTAIAPAAGVTSTLERHRTHHTARCRRGLVTHRERHRALGGQAGGVTAGQHDVAQRDLSLDEVKPRPSPLAALVDDHVFCPGRPSSRPS
jgi:hypothetical protein